MYVGSSTGGNTVYSRFQCCFAGIVGKISNHMWIAIKGNRGDTGGSIWQQELINKFLGCQFGVGHLAASIHAGGFIDYQYHITDSLNILTLNG